MESGRQAGKQSQKSLLLSSPNATRQKANLANFYHKKWMKREKERGRVKKERKEEKEREIGGDDEDEDDAEEEDEK